MTESVISHHRILVIDDNRAIHQDFRKILCPPAPTVLEAENALFGSPPAEPPAPSQPVFDVVSAYQGEDAIALVQAAVEAGQPFGLAFIDVRMPPGMDGLETAERLWQIQPDLEIVLCTAYSDYSWADLTQRLTANRERLLVLKKPFAPVEVLPMACRLTQRWALTRQAHLRLAELERLVQTRTEELRETTERLTGETRQRQAAEQHLIRSQRLQSVGALASGMAHDLNNTISPIFMAAQMLRLEQPGEMHEQMVETIESSAERAAAIVRQMLTFAQGVDGEKTLLLPKYLVGEIEKIARGSFPRHIVMTTRVGQDLPLIRGEGTLLHQVLMNLCVNSRDSMPDGGSLLVEADEVLVDAALARRCPEACEGSYVRLRVSDTGHGIPGEAMTRIFDPFFTTKEPGRGTGLGLSMVAGIVKSHEGFCEVQSEVGIGTMFSVYLPSVFHEGEASASAPAEPPAHVGSGEVILVVDDDEAIRESVSALLTPKGYRVLTACDGAEALCVYARQWNLVSLVITDIIMPVVDGIDLCRALRVMSPELPIITCSGFADDYRMSELAFLNLQAVLSMPMRPETLLGAIRQALTKSGAEQFEHIEPTAAVEV